MSNPSNGQSAAGSGRRHTAGAYDVRVVIAGLIGFYGLVLLVLGIVDFSEADAAKTGGWNANLWVGLGMLVFAVVFAAWTRLRPVVVEDGRAVEDPSGGADVGGR